MKVLFVATVRSHIGQFHIPTIKSLKERGVEVHAAFKNNSAQKPGLDLSCIDKVFEIPFDRSPFSLKNAEAYRQLKKVIEENNYDAIHCNTPVGSVLSRLIARNTDVKVIYTAHGFHFYKGCPVINRIVFYPIEKYLSKYTDALITINEEDFSLAKSKFKMKKAFLVNGVGVDMNKFHKADNEEKKLLRKQYDISKDDFVLIYPANLTKGKNHEMLFQTLKIILKTDKNVKLLLPGETELLEDFKKRVKELEIEKNVLFMGYRRDIEKLDALSDVSVSSSKREGLPVNIIEAMACANPVVATNVRGNRDLVENDVNGCLVSVDDCESMAKCILKIKNNTDIYEKYSQNSLKKSEKYSNENVVSQILDVYSYLRIL